jgi:hypothetical protein
MEDLNLQTKTKIGRDGQDLPADAPDHVAVRIEHPLLARPLIVTAHRSPKEMTWKQAAKWAESLDVNGWSWRLPTVEEAFFIPDRSKYPALDANFFPDFAGYEWIWTSTPDAETPAGYAWFVNLGGGASDRDGRSYRSHVRAVRAGQ